MAGRDPRRVRRTALLCLAALLSVPLVTQAPPASADVPFPAPPPGASPYDYPGRLFVDDGRCDGTDNDLPSNVDCVDDWKFTDDRADEEPSDAGLRRSAQELFGVKGVGLNRAWEVSTGRPDVVIAVLDSGVRWEEAQPQLTRKYQLNRGELPVPAGGPNGDDWRFGGYDVNGDGAFTTADYAAGMRLAWHGERVTLTEFADDENRVLDPADLIRVFSDGVDDDGNGYVDDISGWDFFENDNNPLDDVDYGHGTGGAHDSAAEADLAGHDEVGTCPNCMMMPLPTGTA
ncbi:MAG: hypothetical protein ACRDPK_21055 [Carbonactinosporaceae bacterium]